MVDDPVVTCSSKDVRVLRQEQREGEPTAKSGRRPVLDRAISEHDATDERAVVLRWPTVGSHDDGNATLPVQARPSLHDVFARQAHLFKGELGALQPPL
jgi:hypothetical protein